jgi:probable HAF family extracellular repeat protein
MCYTQNRFNALLSACVMSLIATAGWSQSLTWLGVLPDGLHSYAYAVSADGSVVVGWARDAAGEYRAFRWTASRWHGRPEHDLCQPADQSCLSLDSSHLQRATAISPDGRYIVGWGYNAERYEAFLLDTGFPRRGDATATAAWTTLTCCKCCSPSVGAATATKTSTGTAQ